jgi:hypothetical protein
VIVIFPNSSYDVCGIISLNFHLVFVNNKHLLTINTSTVKLKCSFIKNAGGKIETNEMGGACGAYYGGERCVQGSGGET